MARHYLQDLYHQASRTGWIPKDFRKGTNNKNRPSSRHIKELVRETEDQEQFETSIRRSYEREKPEEEKSYLDRAVVNYKGGLYFRPFIKKEDMTGGPEAYQSKLTPIADCEVRVSEAIEYLQETPGRLGHDLEIKYRVQLTNAKKSVPAELSADDLLKPTNFSRLLISKGFTPFAGTSQHFQLFLDFIIKHLQYPTIRTYPYWGEIEPGVFLFANGIYDTHTSKFHASDSHYRIPYKDAYIVCADGSEQVSPPHFHPAGPDSESRLADLFTTWEALNGMINVRTTVCFAIASLFSRQIQQEYNAFPLLFNYGQQGTGKSTSMDWFMALFGYKNGNRQSISKSNTTKSVIRRMTLPRYFPFFLDDYRNHETNSGVPDITSLILNWFHHIGSGMAKKSTDNQTLDQPMKANVVMTGNDKPTDTAVLDRLLILDYTRHLSQQELRKLNLITNLEDHLPEFIALLLEHYREVKGIFFDKIPHYKDLLADNGFDGRTCFKWSLILAAHDTILSFIPSLQAWDDSYMEFYHKLVETISKEKTRQVENTPLVQFFEAVNIYALESEKSLPFSEDIKVLDDRHFKIIQGAPIKDHKGNVTRTMDVLALHLGRVWEALNRHYSPVTRTYSKQMIQSLMENSPYFVEKSQQVALDQTSKGSGKANLRCHFLNLAKLQQSRLLEAITGDP